ncbi:MAG: serine/threonine-protein phosphatase, partial [Gammaproteobacteria bacterium]|nr:serine/threonine-protein phosphatase [Gammaproteobacteria bacterium]
LLLCSDGFWGGLSDQDIAAVFAGLNQQSNIQELVQQQVENAVANNSPGSDNTTVAAILWRGSD